MQLIARLTGALSRWSFMLIHLTAPVCCAAEELAFAAGAAAAAALALVNLDQRPDILLAMI
jgi:hypothetical protein